MKRTNICYIISHGFAARMLLQTGLIQQLTEHGKSIAIITPDPDDKNLIELKTNPLVKIYDPEIQQTIWDDDYGFKRMYYLEDLKSNPVFWEKHLYSIFYSKSIHPWKRIRPFYYYLIYQLIKLFPSIRSRFQKTEGKHLISKKASNLIKEIQPELVVSTYPINFLEAKFLYAAKQLEVKTMIHLLSWDNITSKGIFPVIPDYFIVWGKVMFRELKEYYGVSDSQVQICGVPHFDHHINVKKNPGYEELLVELSLDPNKPYLFVAMSSPRFAPHEIDIVEWLAKAINDNVFGKDLQLIIRPHPQNVQGALSDKKWIGRLDNLRGDRIAVDYPQLLKSKVRWSMRKSDMDHLSNLLLGCSICLNSGSTVSIDALIMEKPVILTSFDGDKKLNYWKSARRLIDYTHQKKFVALGGAETVFSYEELEQSIHKYLEDPNYRSEERQNALSMECHLNDGKSTSRVVETVLEFLKKLNAVNV